MHDCWDLPHQHCDGFLDSAQQLLIAAKKSKSKALLHILLGDLIPVVDVAIDGDCELVVPVMDLQHVVLHAYPLAEEAVQVAGANVFSEVTSI